MSTTEASRICTACSLWQDSLVNNLPGEGSKDARILVIGESPGEVEEAQSRPFVGPAGQKLFELLSRFNISRQDVYLANVLGCRKRRTVVKDDVIACKPNFLARIDGLNPDVVILLGGIALFGVNGKTKILENRGLQSAWERFPSAKVVATVHPAAILRNPSRESLFLQDLDLVFPRSKESVKVNHRVARTIPEIESLVSLLCSVPAFAFDIETNSILSKGFDYENDKILCIGFSTKPLEAYVVPFLGKNSEPIWSEQEYARVVELMRRAFASESRKIAHNYMFDAQFLATNDMVANGEIFCTLLAHFLLDEEKPHGLDYLAEALTPFGSYKDDFRKLIPHIRSNSFDTIDPKELWKYLAYDVDTTMYLANQFETQLKKADLWDFYWRFTEPLLKTMIKASRHGILIDKEQIGKATRVLAKKNEKLNEKIKEELGDETFNFSSPKQMGDFLFKKLNLKPVKMTPSGRPAVSEDVLKRYAKDVPIVKDLLEYRQTRKFISTFLGDEEKGLISHIHPNGRVYPDVRVQGTVTGRTTYKNPTLLTLPDTPLMRGLVCAPEGSVIISADYSGADLQIAAAYSQDDAMKEALKKNFHNEVARTIFNLGESDKVTAEQRQMAKSTTFGISFGMQRWGLAKLLGIPDEEAGEYIDRFFSKFHKFRDWRKGVVQFALRNGYIRNCFGRRRRFDAFFTLDRETERAKYNYLVRQALNFPMQSGTADATNFADIRAMRRFEETKLNSCTLFTVYDAIIVESLKEEAELTSQIIREEMEAPIKQLYNLIIPVDIVTSDRWIGKKKEMFGLDSQVL